ncbi:hypothetical protein [Alicyclobacillus sp.]|uniref:hypothetical protein n=1 Tax=Alicyclobacillus sp. TaxID=61169 RepID=UPI0025BDE7B6|nr:hypothetical protein [Alicyclobacillus sp.]MCL6517893.1 hypothetical protein [Alicyclobacillus sp.]
MDAQMLREVLTDVLSEVLPIHLKPIEERLDRLEQHVEALEQRMEALEQRVEALEQRMEALEQRVEAIEQRVEAIEQRVEAIEQGVEAIEQGVARVERRLEAVEKRLAEVETRLSSTHAMVTQLIHDVGRVNEVMFKTNQRVDLMEGTYLRHELRLNRHRDQIGEISEEIAMVRERGGFSGVGAPPLSWSENPVDKPY